MSIMRSASSGGKYPLRRTTMDGWLKLLMTIRQPGWLRGLAEVSYLLMNRGLPTHPSNWLGGGGGRGTAKCDMPNAKLVNNWINWTWGKKGGGCFAPTEVPTSHDGLDVPSPLFFGNQPPTKGAGMRARTMMEGRLKRPMAMRQPGMFLSQPGSDTLASYHCAHVTVPGGAFHNLSVCAKKAGNYLSDTRPQKAAGWTEWLGRPHSSQCELIYIDSYTLIENGKQTKWYLAAKKI